MGSQVDRIHFLQNLQFEMFHKVIPEHRPLFKEHNLLKVQDIHTCTCILHSRFEIVF